MALIKFFCLIVLLLLVVLVLGAPVAFSIGFVAVMGVILFMPHGNLLQFAAIIYNQGTNLDYLIISMFLLMAELLSQGDIAHDIFTVLYKYVKKINGGIGIAAILTSTVFAALCGSSAATAAAIGRISIKEMINLNYDRKFSIGLVAAGGTIGIMIPPSIPMVVYGIITETSIVKLFMAGILPGLLISTLLITYVLIKGKLTPEIVGVSVGTNKNNKLHHPSKDKGQVAISFKSEYDFNRQSFIQDFKLIGLPILLIVVILASLYAGMATPIEMAGLGVIGTMLIILITKRFSIQSFLNSLRFTAKNSAMNAFILFAGFSLSYVVSYLGLPQQLASLLTTYIHNKWIIIIVLYIMWFLLGMILDTGSMIILTIPFVFSTLIGYGFDPIWLGVVSTLCVQIAMITPPVGLVLFILKGVTDAPMSEIILGCIPFILILLFSLLILTIFPQIATYIPSLM